jgi:cytosine deaminase
VPDVLLRSVTLPDGTVADVTLADGRIASVHPAGHRTASEPEHAADDQRARAHQARQPTEVHDLTGYVLLPAPAEPHAHLDKAFTADLVPNPDGHLLGAITAWIARYPERTVDEVAERARRAARHNLAQGCTAIRTHVDVNHVLGSRAVEALARVKADLADLVDLQIVGLPGRPTSGPDDGALNRAALEDSLGLGVDVIGGCPHIDPDPAWCVDYALTLAGEHGLPVDLHVDENLDAASHDLECLARRVLETGFPHGVTASHCVSLGVQDETTQRTTAKLVAEAGISVVTLPQTNLYLQARGQRCAPPRGLTAVESLLEAGVNLAGGGDNLQDPFNVVGRGDPLETAALLVMTAHLDPATAYHLVSNAARRLMGLPEIGLEPGDPAELLAVRASSLREAVAFAPADRLVFHRGRLVARTSSTTEIAAGC